VEYRSGVLTITTNYSEDLERRDCILVFAYDPSLILSLAFAVQSDNESLTISAKLSQFEGFYFIFRALSYASMALLVLSLPHKLLGAKLLVGCQLVYLSYCFHTAPSGSLGL
jgi:hypothetical protein